MDITGLLRRIHEGDDAAFHEVMPYVYDELRRLAASHVRRQGPGSSIEATTLVHEAYLRLVQSKQPEYGSRAHFFAIASRVMRQVLVDAARARLALKRGGEPPLHLGDLSEFGQEPDAAVIAVDDALSRLARISELKASLIEMRYFGGMTAEDCAQAKGMSVHMVRKELRLAQAWLRAELAGASRS
jgi:RNA polymerase sigma factor (TIGR02999 family)